MQNANAFSFSLCRKERFQYKTHSTPYIICNTIIFMIMTSFDNNTSIVPFIVAKLSYRSETRYVKKLARSMEKLSALKTLCWNKREQMLNGKLYKDLNVFIVSLDKGSEEDRRMLMGFGSYYKFMTMEGMECSCCADNYWSE